MDRWSFNKNCIDLSIDLITFYRNSISIAYFSLSNKIRIAVARWGRSVAVPKSKKVHVRKEKENTAKEPPTGLYRLQSVLFTIIHR